MMPSVGYSEVMFAALVPAALVACWTDVRANRVPNWLNGLLLASGIGVQAGYFGWAGVQASLLGILAGFGILLPLWLMHVMGAGDVKFMAGLGAWMGSSMTIQALIVGGLLGGMIGIGMIVLQRHWREAKANLAVMMTKVSSVRMALSEFGSAPELGRTSSVMPYAVPLSLGSMVVLIGRYTGWWEGL